METTKVKFKSLYNQYLSNKCAVIIRFNYYNTTLTFIGCQLEFGREYSSYRISNLRDIHKYAFRETQVGQKESDPILDDDVIFLFGNMNTNISPNCKNTIVEQFSKNTQNLTLEQRRIISDLLETDEFQPIQESTIYLMKVYSSTDITKRKRSNSPLPTNTSNLNTPSTLRCQAGLIAFGIPLRRGSCAANMRWLRSWGTSTWRWWEISRSKLRRSMKKWRRL